MELQTFLHILEITLLVMMLMAIASLTAVRIQTHLSTVSWNG